MMAAERARAAATTAPPPASPKAVTLRPKAAKVSRKKIPFHGGQKCYACSSKVVVGLRDRRPEGHDIEIACARHADPTIKVYEACMYCDGPVRKGSVSIDGQFAHKSCHDMVVDDTFHGVMEKRAERRRIKR